MLYCTCTISHLIRNSPFSVIPIGSRNIKKMANAETGKKCAAYRAVDDWLKVFFYFYIDFLGWSNRRYWKRYNCCLRS